MAVNYGSLPFDEQIRFFREKDLIPTRRWNDIWKESHDSGFMVAGAMKADLLADLNAAVDKAISQGTTLAEFRKDFDSIVARHGWTGWTGEETASGRAWRTKVIYETNLRTSYQAGRWAQVQRVKDRRPYLLYRHSDAVLHPRPLHLSWDGLVVRADDPWVKTHWPPNGWGCKCRMFSLSDRDLDKMGKSGPDTPPDDGTYTWTDKVTGEVHTVPKGIDPGWDYAPGASRVDLLKKQIGRKVKTLPPEIAKPLNADMTGIASSWRFIGKGDLNLDTVKALGQARLSDWLSTPVSQQGKAMTLAEAIDHPWEIVAGGAAKSARDALLAELHLRRGTGGVKPALWNLRGEGRRVIERAASRFPDAWVSAANQKPLRVRISKARGYYVSAQWNRAEGRNEAFIRTDASSTAEHEYAHHLQHMLPELDAVFQAEHRRRTAGDPLEVLFTWAKSERGRPDQYVDRYQGREYGHNGALEVLTMAFQGLLGEDKFANELLAKMLKSDQEMLRVALGLLFHFRP